MKLSYVIVTYNRREPLLKTLSILRQNTPLPRDQWETWVVDNASTDGTVEAVKEQFPEINLLVRPSNEGVWARSHAFAPANGKYFILLDDDSYPIGDAASRSIEYLDITPKCGGRGWQSDPSRRLARSLRYAGRHAQWRGLPA